MTDTKTHIVLDLETMGNSQTAAIVAVGAAACTIERGVFSTFYAEVSLEDSVARGLTMDVSTVLWWMRQKDEARKIFEKNAIARHLSTVIEEFDSWFHILPGEFEDKLVWGNGADFDNAILKSAYKALGRTEPWTYYNNRCLRTLRAENSDVNKPAFIGVPHHALDDAKNQAAHLLAIKRKALYGANPTGQLKALS